MLRARIDPWTMRLARGAVVLLALAAALAGCATKPVAEFSAYKEAFQSAREAGEAVLLDHSAALALHAEMKAAAATPDREREFDYDAASIAAEGDAPDDVTVRFRAWQVVGQYNDALTALIEGRPKAEISSAVGGLIDSLKTFPIGALADAAGSLTPFGGLITTVLDQVQQAYEAEQFREAVLAGSELIPGFVDLCVADTGNYYAIRRALRDDARDAIMDGIASDVRIFRLVLQNAAAVRAEAPAGASRASAETAAQAAQRLNLLLVQLGAPQQDVGAGLGDETLSITLHHDELAALQTIIDRTAERAERAGALDDALLAYRDTLIAYVRMLHQLELANGTLRTAAERRVITLAPAEEIFRAAIATRRALATYEEVASK